MLSFLKKIFGVNATESAPVPYKVDAPAKPSEFPFPSTKPVAAPKTEKKPAEKKPAGKKPGARKPRKPQAPKA